MRLRKENDGIREEDVLMIASVSDALAHPARVKIFRYVMNHNLDHQKICNKDIVSAFDYSQATISQHVKRLVTADLFQVKKEERYSYYYVNVGLLGRYMNAIQQFQAG